MCSGFSFFGATGRIRTARPCAAGQAISPAGCCLVRGSQPVGMSNKRLRFTVRPGGFEQQRRRPQPAAETGRSCWGRVLIFQSPAKGLRKNQQTQPVRPCAAGQAISPAGCCLVRGSQPVGMSNKRLRFTVRPGGFEQQRRRPQPAAETGRSCWGRVLIFQSPAKGLRKNQQTQPVRPCAAGQAISPAGCCLVRGSQPVGMSNKRPAVHPGEMELSLFVFHPDAVQSVCDKGLPV